MDPRMEKIVKKLEASGYGAKWSDHVSERKWFDLEAAESILQIITENAYTRVALSDLRSEATFMFRHYVSTKFPRRPKTDFYIDPFGQLPKTLDEMLQFINGLGNSQQQEAA